MSEQTLRRAAVAMLAVLAILGALTMGVVLSGGRQAAVSPQADPVAANATDADVAADVPEPVWIGPTRVPGISDGAATALARTSARRATMQAAPPFTPEPILSGQELSEEMDANTPRIEIDEALARLATDEALLVDVRSGPQYRLEHAAGAIHVPVSTMSELMQEMPRDKDLIFYCACDSEQTSAIAVRAAQNAGIDRAYALRGGWDAWLEGGHPTEEGEPEQSADGEVLEDGASQEETGGEGSVQSPAGTESSAGADDAPAAGDSP